VVKHKIHIAFITTHEMTEKTKRKSAMFTRDMTKSTQ